MLALAALAAVLTGWALGGRLRRISQCPLRALPLPLLAYALQAAGQMLASRLSWDSLGPVVVLLSYGLILAFLLFNRYMKKTALLFGMGSLGNFLAIVCNGFRMPVGAAAAGRLSPDGLAALAAEEIPLYTLASARTRLIFLGDVLPVPGLGAASVGDALLVLGLFFCVMAVMRPTRPVRLRAFWAAG